MGLAERDYMKENYRANRDRFNSKGPGRPPSPGGASKWGMALVAVTLVSAAVHLGRGIIENGWLPDFSAGEPFPETGSVYVPKGVMKHHRMVPFTVQARDKDAVVELFDDQNRNMYTLFVRANEVADSRAPIGSWQARFIEGTKWHGMKELFGPNTFKSRVTFNMVLIPGQSQTIDLHRRPDGNLQTNIDLGKPEWQK